MKRSSSNSKSAVFKRNKRKLLNFLTAFPPGERPSIPNNFFEFPVSLIYSNYLKI